MTTSYHYQKLQSESNTNRDLLAEVAAGEHHQGKLWGAFTGLFGLAGNEVILVSSLAAGQTAGVSPRAKVSEIWQPTARPADTAACTAAGLYVFRRFHVLAENVEEVVALSKQAWTTFETGDDYAAEPRGLFQPEPDDNGIVRLMLVTWYDGFKSWEISRRPAPDATQNFQRRHALTKLTYAVATVLASG